MSRKIIEAIQKIYPTIKGGFIYWETQPNVCPETGNYLGERCWENPIDGLAWENTEFEKPTWEQIEEKLIDVDLEAAKAIKRKEINGLRDSRMAKDVCHKVGGKDYLFQRNITANLAWINYLESGSEVAVTNWVTADNSIIDISQSDLVSICAHIRDRDTQAVVQARRSKNLLETLTTIEEVEAFDINQVFEI